MRSLILHADKFATKVVEKSKWPKGVCPEEKKSDSEEMAKCLVVFFCVEDGDGKKQVDAIYDEILKTADEVKTKNLMISPFVHLSSNIAKPDVAKKLYDQMEIADMIKVLDLAHEEMVKACFPSLFGVLRTNLAFWNSMKKRFPCFFEA